MATADDFDVNKEIKELQDKLGPSWKNSFDYVEQNLSSFRSAPANPKFSKETVFLTSTIGFSKFGDVYGAKMLASQHRSISGYCKFTVKQLKREHYYPDEMYRQRDALIKLQHPGIVRLAGAFVYFNAFLVLEYCIGSYDQFEGEFTVNTKKRFTLQLIDAVAFMHDKEYIHRNIIPSNILISGGSVSKLSGFGLIVRADTNGRYKASKFEGTIEYSPAEVLRGNDYSYSSDVFSLAVTVYEFFENKPLLWDPKTEMPTKDSVMERINYGRRTATLPVPKFSKIEDEFAECAVGHHLNGMLHNNPRQRPNCNQIIERTTMFESINSSRKELFHASLNKLDDYRRTRSGTGIVAWPSADSDDTNDDSNALKGYSLCLSGFYYENPLSALILDTDSVYNTNVGQGQGCSTKVSGSTDRKLVTWNEFVQGKSCLTSHQIEILKTFGDNKALLEICSKEEISEIEQIIEFGRTEDFKLARRSVELSKMVLSKEISGLTEEQRVQKMQENEQSLLEVEEDFIKIKYEIVNVVKGMFGGKFIGPPDEMKSILSKIVAEYSDSPEFVTELCTGRENLLFCLKSVK